MGIEEVSCQSRTLPGLLIHTHLFFGSFARAVGAGGRGESNSRIAASSSSNLHWSRLLAANPPALLSSLDVRVTLLAFQLYWL